MTLMDTTPIHPLILRERALWERYQDVSKRKGGDAIANCCFPFTWGVFVAMIDAEAMQRDWGTIDGAAPVLDAFEKGLDHVEQVYPDLPGRG